MTRSEHLQWAKSRAKEYIDAGDWITAWSFFSSDLMKHEETRTHAGLQLGLMMIVGGQITDSRTLWEHIDGYQ